jgi:hypothetical protein
MDNWLRYALELEEKLEKAEYQAWMNAYKHCKQLCNNMSFMTEHNGRVLRLSDIEDICNKNIEYYERMLKENE